MLIHNFLFSSLYPSTVYFSAVQQKLKFLSARKGGGCHLWALVFHCTGILRGVCISELTLPSAQSSPLVHPLPPKKILSYTWVSLRQNMPNLIFINNRLLDMCDYYKQTVLIHVCLTVKFFSNEIYPLINIKGTTYSLLRDWYICVFQQPL